MPIYGSSRLGQHNGEGTEHQLAAYKRIYEYANHLGNVLATTHDNGDILSLSDYFPFGLAMEDRSFQEADYRYGFNGKENDTDLSSSQLIQDYGFRVYNPVIGKFLSVDPLTKSYPWYTPYQFAGNTPIQAIDLDGLEEKYSITYEESKEKPILGLLGVPGVTIRPIINNSVPAPRSPFTTPPKYSFRILSFARLSPLIFLSLEGESEEKKRIDRWNLDQLEEKFNRDGSLTESEYEEYKNLVWLIYRFHITDDNNKYPIEIYIRRFIEGKRFEKSKISELLESGNNLVKNVNTADGSYQITLIPIDKEGNRISKPTNVDALELLENGKHKILEMKLSNESPLTDNQIEAKKHVGKGSGFFEVRSYGESSHGERTYSPGDVIEVIDYDKYMKYNRNND